MKIIYIYIYIYIYIFNLNFLFFKVPLVLPVTAKSGKPADSLLEMVKFSQGILRILRHSRTSKNTT